MKDHFFRIILFLFSLGIFAQSPRADKYFKDKGFGFKVQSKVLLPSVNNSNISKNSYKLNYTSYIMGVNTELTYYLNPIFGVGIGLGYEKINQPNISYYPLSFHLITVLEELKNSLFMQAHIGTHLGNLDKRGILLRFSSGYRFQLYKRLLCYAELFYSIQNMAKNFKEFPRDENSYMLKSTGFSIGIELN